LKIKAVDIQSGDRIIAYCNNKMQICTVKCILDPDLTNINLSVATSEASRNSISRVVRFRRDALVELHAKGANALADSSSPDEEVVAHPTSSD
jgi:hypothetical protein